MTVFGLAIGAALFFWLAVYLTRRQIALAQADRAIPEALGFVVAVDSESGRIKAVTDDLAMMRRTWHPIRFPYEWESRCAGLPAEKAYVDAGFAGRRVWCEEHCQGAWRVENPTSPGPIFWFEQTRDATDFSLAWYPFKCV
ncbi:MAG: hypothetical protein HQ481_08320 [Alphaproteobacteria bacterium]|nr:hypothetical protein [Alphaproteobacteria bacterium]